MRLYLGVKIQPWHFHFQSKHAGWPGTLSIINGTLNSHPSSSLLLPKLALPRMPFHALPLEPSSLSSNRNVSSWTPRARFGALKAMTLIGAFASLVRWVFQFSSPFLAPDYTSNMYSFTYIILTCRNRILKCWKSAVMPSPRCVNPRQCLRVCSVFAVWT